MVPTNLEIIFICFKPDFTKKCFKQIHLRKAPGPDGLKGKILRQCAFQLENIFWAQALSPVARRSQSSQCKNLHMQKWCANYFRPITLTSLISKCMERLVMKDLTTQSHRFSTAHIQRKDHDTNSPSHGSSTVTNRGKIITQTANLMDPLQSHTEERSLHKQPISWILDSHIQRKDHYTNSPSHGSSTVTNRGKVSLHKQPISWILDSHKQMKDLTTQTANLMDPRQSQTNERSYYTNSQSHGSSTVTYRGKIITQTAHLMDPLQSHTEERSLHKQPISWILYIHKQRKSECRGFHSDNPG